MTKRFNISCLTTVGLLLAASPALVSQVNTGQISGKVTDANNRPLRGARVTLTAPQLMAQRNVATNDAGDWIAPLLPPGDYTIRISADGHVGQTIGNVRIGVGANLRRNMSLRPVSVATETVEIIADTTVVDKADTRTAINFSGADIIQTSNMAVGQGTWIINNVLKQTAGAMGEGGAARVIRGTNAQSLSYRINGGEVSNPWTGGDFMNAVMTDQVEDVAVVLSPTNARYGRVLGGAIDIVTKSGGNQFTGSIRAEQAYRYDAWEGKTRRYEDMRYNDIDETNYSDTYSERTWQVNLAGPIIKDRVWFAIGARIKPDNVGPNDYDGAPWNIGKWNNLYKRSFRTGHVGIDALTNVISTPGVSQYGDPSIKTIVTPGPGSAPQIANYRFPVWPQYPEYFNYRVNDDHYNFKLTWAVNENHKVEFGGHHWTLTSKGVFGELREEMYDGGGNRWWNNDQSWTASYSGILSSDTFLEAKFSRAKGWNESPQGDGSIYYEGQPKYPRVYVSRGNLVLTDQEAAGTTPFAFQTWSSMIGFGMGLTERNSMAGSVNLTMYRNLFDINHHFDVGVDFFQGDARAGVINGEANNSTYVGGVFEGPGGAGDWLYPVIRWTGPGQFGQNLGNGDRGLAPWRIQNYGEVGDRKIRNLAFYANDQMTINDNWNVMLGLRYDSNAVIDIDGTTKLSSSHISPRFTLTYDPKGDSSNVFKLSYMFVQQEYHAGFADMFTQSSPAGRSIQYVWTGTGINQPMPGVDDFNDPRNPGVNMYGLRFVTLQQLMDPANYGNAQIFSDNTRNNMMDPNLTPQNMTEYALEYRKNYDGGSYFRAAYVNRVIGNFVTGRLNYHPDFWVTLDTQSIAGEDLGLRPMYSQTRHWMNDSSLKNVYHGFEFETTTRINSILNMRLAYTFSQLRGNYAANNAGATNLTSAKYDQDLYHKYAGTPDEWRFPSGSLGDERPHNFFGTLIATVPLTRGGWISYSTTVQYMSGSNWSITRPYAYDSSYFINIYNANNLPAPNPVVVSRPGATWTKYHSALGAYHNMDNFDLQATIAWEVPIWKMVKFMGNVSIMNVLNRIYHNGYYRADDPNVGTGAGVDVVSYRTDRYGGYRNDGGYDSYTNYPRLYQLSMGLKF